MKELKRDEASLENVCPGLLDFGHVAGCTQSRLHCIPLRKVTLAKLDSVPRPACPTPGYFTSKVKERICCQLVASLPRSVKRRRSNINWVFVGSHKKQFLALLATPQSSVRHSGLPSCKKFVLGSTHGRWALALPA